ncbi:T9SS type A sorting domain-containing protein [Psychroflexus aestuariivivens]
MNQKQVNLSELQSGVYILSLTDVDGQQSHVKVVRE